MIKFENGMNGPALYLDTDADARIWLRDKLGIAVEAKHGQIHISLIDRQPEETTDVVTHYYTEQEWERYLQSWE